MIGHIIVGQKRSGKTTFVKDEILKKVNRNSIMVYDVNNEYTDIIGSEKELPDIEDFLKVATLVKRGVIVLEECTIFFSTRSNNIFVRDLLVRTRHTKNYIVLVFHSVRSIPRNIFELCDYITIFQTHDSPDMSGRELKNDQIAPLMELVKEQSSKNPHYHVTMKIQ